MHLFCISTPFPCLLLFRNYPLQRLPSGQLAYPLPLGVLFFHCPSYLNPYLSKNLPYPSATLFLRSPSQQLPFALMYLPFPQQRPSTKSPSRQSPFLNQSEPYPLGFPSETYPQYQAFSESINILFSSPTLLNRDKSGSWESRILMDSLRLSLRLLILPVREASSREWEMSILMWDQSRGSAVLKVLVLNLAGSGLEDSSTPLQVCPIAILISIFQNNSQKIR